MKTAHISNFPVVLKPLFIHLRLIELRSCRMKKNSWLWRSVWKATSSSAEQEEKILCELFFQTPYFFSFVQNLLFPSSLS